jgi:hypothetical protein
VRDGAELFTYLTEGDIYVNWPRDDPNWKPHASFRASGQHHQKSHNKKMALAYCEKPDANFRGARMLAGTPISADEPRKIDRPCQLADFDDALEIPHGDLRPEKYRNMITVEIVEWNHVADIVPNGRIVRQAVFKDAVPWIVLTLWETQG